jgi:hypothetical protein
MLAWWTFDEASGTTAAEIVGGANGALVGAASHVPGHDADAANAVQMIGVGDYVRLSPVPANLDFGTGNFSIDAWVLANNAGLTSVRTIVDHRAGTSPTGYTLSISFGRIILQLANGGGGFTNYNSPNVFLTNGAWHHIAATVDRTPIAGHPNGIITFYEGGQPQGPVVDITQTGSVTNSGDLRIGQAYDGSSIGFNGNIDEVEVIGNALPADKVKAIFDRGVYGKCKAAVPLPGLAPYGLMLLAVLMGAVGLVVLGRPRSGQARA